MPKRPVSPVTESTPTPPEPTVAELLAGAEAAEDAAALAAARQSLAPSVAIAQKGLPIFREHLPEATRLLARAKPLDLPQLGALGCPGQQLLWPLESFRNRVAGIPDAIRQAESALADAEKLTGRECRRNPGRVEGIRTRLHSVGAGPDILAHDLAALAEYIGRVGGWVRGHVAQRGPLQPVEARDPIRGESRRTELAFDPMKTP